MDGWADRADSTIQILDRLPMTLGCLRDSGIGKEVKRVSKSSSSNSGEQKSSTDQSRVHPSLLPSHLARIKCPPSELSNSVEKFEFQSAMPLKRHRIKNLTATSPFRRTQRFGTWHQTSLLNGVLSSLPGNRRRRLRKPVRVSHASSPHRE